MYYLGIDAGGSTCRARIESDTGEVLGEGRSGPANFRIGMNAFVDTVSTAYRGAMDSAELADSDLSTVVAGFGIAGINRLGAREALQKHPWPFARVSFASDAEIANLGAHGGADGGTVIVGTGSIGIARVGEKTFRVGGYGFPGSDAGSGAYIGLRAVQATLRARDRLLAASALTEDVVERIGRDNGAIVDWLDKANAPDFAALAPHVVHRAKGGDPVAVDIMRRAARHISDMLRALADHGAPRLTLSGGLASSIQDYLEPDLRKRLCEPKTDPLGGAILLAKRAA